MTIGPGQYRYPRSTLLDLIQDHERRILNTERRGSLANVDSRAIVVSTITEYDIADDPDVAVYAEDTGLVHYQGDTYTWDAWQALHAGPVAPSIPVGVIFETIASAAPTGWLMLDGSSIPNADVAYPALWALPAVTAWKSGTTLNLPDMSGKTLVGGGTTGAEGGSMSHSLALANLPSHSHTMAHTHTMPHTHDIDHDHASFNTNTGDAGSHAHVFDASNNPTSLSNGRIARSAGGTATTFPTDTEPAHSHSVSINVPAFAGTSGAASSSTTSGSSAANTGTAGSGTAVDHTPAHLRVNYMIRAA